MTDDCLVSVLIPVYNVQDFIIRCLDSVVQQTYKGKMECILVDDCGTDDSMVLAEEWIAEKGDRRFRILHHKTNRGLAAARNTAVEAASGDFVMHLDSDDWLEFDAIEQLIKKQQETNADIVSGNAVRHDVSNNSILVEPEYATKMEMVWKMIELNIDHVIWRRLIRRSLYTDNSINAVEGINIGEDHHTLPKLAFYAKKCVRLDKVVYHYNCINENSYMHSISREAQIKRFHSDLASINILLAFFDDKDEKSVKRLKEIKSFFLYRFVTDCYFKKEERNYNDAMQMLYLMGNDCLTLVGLTGIWQRCIRRTYNRYRLYNFIKTHIK